MLSESTHKMTATPSKGLAFLGAKNIAAKKVTTKINAKTNGI